MSQTEFTATLQTTISQWTTFNLESRKPTLDKNATQTKNLHTQSQNARKTLADTTKSFKKSVKHEASTNPNMNDKFSNECKFIIKSYQEEIDKLTKRCKFTDSNYLELYKALMELNDPSSVLIKANEHLNSMNGQVCHLLKGMEEISNEMETRQVGFDQVVKEKDGLLNEYELKIKHLEQELLKQQQQHQQQQQQQQQTINEHLNQQNHKMEEGGSASSTSKLSSSSSGHIIMNKEEKEELISLRREVAEYEVEFKTLKNQDITIKKLNTKIEDLITNQEFELQNELKKAQQHLAETEGRRATAALEREASTARKLASIELQLKAERAGSQVVQSHLLENDNQQNEREIVWDTQRQILIDDAERLREMLYDIGRERDDLKLKFEALNGMDHDGSVGGGGSGTGGSSMRGNGNDGGQSSLGGSGMNGDSDILAERKAYEAEVAELTLTVTAIRDEIRTKDETMMKLQSSMQDTIESLENERGYLSKKVSTLEAEITNAPTKEMIDNMRRELRILKNLAYNTDDVDGIDTEKEEPEMTSTPDNNGDHGGGDDLESVLIGKLRKIETDLVKERREKNAYFSECDSLKEQLDGLVKAKSEGDALIARLEADLEKAITVPSTTSTSRGHIGGARMVEPEIAINTTSDPSSLEHILDPSIPVPPPPAAFASSKMQSTSAAEKMNDDHSVATIILAQRDRLRAKCDSLEAERDGFKRELQMQVATSESLKTDNTKLYEKVRYLQNFKNSSGGGGSGMHLRNNNTSVTDRDLDLEALEQRYEASVDPFRQFSRAERQRKMKEMSPMEKTVFVVARTVLGSKEMRTALFFYVVILHLLVFATTYHWSHGCHSVPHQHHSVIDSLHAGIPDVAPGDT